MKIEIINATMLTLLALKCYTGAPINLNVGTVVHSNILCPDLRVQPPPSPPSYLYRHQQRDTNRLSHTVE